MKKTLATLAISIFALSACQKSVNTPETLATNTPAENNISVVASPAATGISMATACYPSRTCHDISMGACLIMFPPDGQIPGDDWLFGNAYVDDQGGLVLSYNATPQFLQQAPFDGTYGIAQDIEIPQEVTNQLYAGTAFEAPAAPLVIKKGVYPAKRSSHGRIDIDISIGNVEIHIHIKW